MIHTPLTDFTFFKKIVDAGGAIFVVGGSLRDEFLKRPIKDWDIIVRLIPFADLVKILKGSGYTNLVGRSFGVIKFHPREEPNLEIDIALPRVERSTGSGHKDFEVDFNEQLDVREDLMRRDFTINALAKNLVTGELIDPSGGMQDLKQMTIRTVFDNSFLEDPLRLLRAVQFSARLGFTIAPSTLNDMKKHAALIKTVAPERIIQEIKKLFEAPIPSVGFDIMRDSCLLPYIFPDVQKMIGIPQPKKKNEDVYTHTMKALDAARYHPDLENAGNRDIMFAALLHDTGKPKTFKQHETDGVSFLNHHIVSSGITRRWLKDYKATTIGVDPKRVIHLVKHHMFETRHFLSNEKALRRFINKIGKEFIFDLIDLRIADKKGGRYPEKVYGILKLRERIKEELAKKPPFLGKDLALNGHEIMALGFKAGPILGDIQRFLIEKVLDTPELNTKEALTKLIKENFKTL